MGKRKNVTDAEVSDLIARMGELSLEVMGVADDIRNWHCDDLTDTTGKAREAATLARHAADMAAAILSKAAFMEREAEIARLHSQTEGN